MEIREGYKKTDVGVIPLKWVVLSFDELFTFNGGLSASRDQLSSKGLCYLHYGDIHKSMKTFIDVSGEFLKLPKLDIQKQKVSNNALLNNGDVVFVDASEDDDGASKHIVIRNKEEIPFISGLHTIVSKPKDSTLDNLYKEFCFQDECVKKQFKFYSAGTKVCGVSKSNITKMLLPIPPLPEQQAIATALSDIDELISSLKKLIDKRKNIKHGAMQELLTGKKRLEGFKGEWTEVVMTEICDVRDGTHDSPKYQDIGVRFITSKNIVNGKIDYSDINFISKVDAININKRSKVDKNDVLISMIGSIGNAVLLNFNPDFCIKNIAIFKPYIERVVAQYLYQLIISKTYQDYILGSVDGGIQKFVSLGTFRNLLVLLPTLAEQTAIANILSDMDLEIERLQNKLNKYKDIKQGMMQELLTGRIRLVEGVVQ